MMLQATTSVAGAAQILGRIAPASALRSLVIQLEFLVELFSTIEAATPLPCIQPLDVIARVPVPAWPMLVPAALPHPRGKHHKPGLSQQATMPSFPREPAANPLPDFVSVLSTISTINARESGEIVLRNATHALPRAGLALGRAVSLRQK
jgi:hypothetical protein